jgi:hypothetical protein
LLAVVHDTEHRRPALVASDEQQPALLVKRDAARRTAPVLPSRDLLVLCDIDRHARVVPGVRVGAASGRIDHERLGAARHIGCQTAATLRKAGFDARYMAGGHYAWKALKGSVKLFE